MYIAHNIRILRTANAALLALIKQGTLLPCVGETVEGTSGVAYRPADHVLLGGSSLAPLSDLTFQVGSAVIDCNTYALPPEEYAGLLLTSPGFTQRPLAPLARQLLVDLPLDEHRTWLADLAQVALSTPIPDQVPNLLLTAPPVPARWLPSRTRFISTDVGWLLTLVFDVPDPVRRFVIKPSAAGIDLGLRSLAVAAHKSGLIHTARGVPDIQISDVTMGALLPNRPDLHPLLRRLNVAAQHAAAREHLDQFLQILMSSATVVAYEELRYGDMTPHFKRRVRELGLRDFVTTWLPKRLKQAGIPTIRVAPDLTSTLCNTTFRIGRRSQSDWGRFESVNGDVLDADVNAAANVRDLALASLIRPVSRCRA